MQCNVMDVTIAIRDTIFNTVLGAYAHRPDDDSSSSPYQGRNVVIGAVWPGQLIDEAQYGNAWSPTNSSGSSAATENLSLLVDPIPNPGQWYTKSGRKVEQMYKFLLDGAEANGPKGEPDVVFSARSVIPAPEVALPHSIKSELTDRTVVKASLPGSSAIQTLSLTNKAKTRKELEIAHSNAAAALLAHQLAHALPGGKNGLKSRGDKVPPPAELVEEKRKAWAALQKLRPTLKGRSAKPAPYTPASVDKAFYDARMTFERSKLASVRNPGISYHPAYTSPENWVDPAAKENWPLITIPVPGTNPEINLTITFSRIDIDRPWLLTSLFDLTGWKTAAGPGSLSNGQATDIKGSFSLLPQSIIVARDIVARTSTSIVFRSKGLQVLAYVSSVNPFSPPL